VKLSDLNVKQWSRQNFAQGGTGAWRTGSEVRGDSHREVKAIWR